jgi:prepilin-type N-terminal cleavage/methylation domain-containing protein
MQNKKGFTLIELMIVVAIIAILAMIAVPMYQRYIERSRNSATQALLTQVSLSMVAYSVDYNTFLPDATYATAPAIATQLGLFGFRADPNVGLEFLTPAAGNTGFIVYAAHKAPGSRLYVYDNISGSGVQPMADNDYFLDPNTGKASTTKANKPYTGADALVLLQPGASAGAFIAGGKVKVGGDGIVIP